MDFAERVVHCPKCGREFVCRHSAECFCTKYRLTPEVSAKLRSLYNDLSVRRLSARICGLSRDQSSILTETKNKNADCYNNNLHFFVYCV